MKTLLHRLTTPTLLCTLLFATTNIALGQNEPTTSIRQPVQDVEEIRVISNRSLIMLKRQVLQAEVDMFNLFNELNDDDEFDIHCRMEARIGSLIKKQICRPNYIYTATSQEALSFHYSNSQTGVNGSSPSYSIQTATSVPTTIQYNSEILEEKIDAAIQQNPELLEMIQDFEFATEEYTEKRDQYFSN